MSKLAEALRSQKIYNNWDLLKKFGGEMDVVIEYHRPAEGRAGGSGFCGTRIWSPHKNPKLKAAPVFGNGYQIEFRGNRAESFPTAVAWAQTEFREIYAASPFGGRVPKHILSAANRKAQENEK